MSIPLSIDMWTSGFNSFRQAPSNPRVCVPYWSELAMILAVELNSPSLHRCVNFVPFSCICIQTHTCLPVL